MTRIMEREGINRSRSRVANLAVLAALLASGIQGTKAAEPGRPQLTADAPANVAGARASVVGVR